jgi:hypothetical protein
MVAFRIKNYRQPSCPRATSMTKAAVRIRETMAVRRRRELQSALGQYAQDGLYTVKAWGANYPVLHAQPAWLDTRDDLTLRWEAPQTSDAGSWDVGFMMTIWEYGRRRRYFVSDQEYRRPRRSRDTFSDRVNGDKVHVNARVMAVLKRLDPDTKTPVVYLDSAAALTTMALQAAGFQDLVCVNLDGSVPDRAPPFFHDAAQFYHGTLLAWMRDVCTQPHHVLMDYCCSLSGNQDYVRPKADIQLMLALEVLPRHGGVCWMTFSMRRTPRKACAPFKAWVVATAAALGYCMELVEEDIYGGSSGLWYLVWKSV